MRDISTSGRAPVASRSGMSIATGPERVDPARSGGDDVGWGVAAHPPEHGPDPGGELAWPRRLGDVVGGPCLQGENCVELVAAGGHHDHREAGSRRGDPPEDREALGVAELQVEEDQ